MSTPPEIANALANLSEIPDDQLEKIQFTLPSIILDGRGVDADGFPTHPSNDREEPAETRQALQKEVWRMFVRNPQVNTSVRGVTGRITGMGFEASSGHFDVQQAIKEIELDWRNRLYNFWRPYVGRAFIEQELHLIFTCHTDGFIEVDFLDPAVLDGGGDDDTGIIFHPRKTMMPIFYIVSQGGQKVEQIPSIFVARDPNLVNEVKKHDDYDVSLQQPAKDRKHIFRKMGGFYRFVVSWDRGFVTRRAISYLRTTIEWLNYYEDLKKYEIDHKKASGAYAWVVSFEDVKAFKLWMSLSEAERKKTALMQKVVPGSRLFLPPGMKIEAKAPQLPRISDSDTDIMQMAVSGLNESNDVTNGSLNATFASAKASRGPMSDRTSDEVAYFDRFYKYDFWGGIFWLKHLLVGFPERIEVEEVIDFKNGKEIMGKVPYRPEELVDTSYPVSETIDYNNRVSALLGSKHGPLPESLGIDPKEVASRVGFGSYGRNRLRKATHDKKYPPLIYSVDSNAIESKQEKAEGEQPKNKASEKKPAAENSKKQGEK